jgi:hypothetical protein
MGGGEENEEEEKEEKEEKRRRRKSRRMEGWRGKSRHREMIDSTHLRRSHSLFQQGCVPAHLRHRQAELVRFLLPSAADAKTLGAHGVMASSCAVVAEAEADWR